MKANSLRVMILTKELTLVFVIGVALGGGSAYAAPFAYVTNNASNTVSVIDIARNVVVGDQIRVGNEPVLVAVSPDGTLAYVGNNNSGDGTISVIDEILSIGV